MRQAIEEGFILDVLANYTTYSTYYKLANAHPRNDPEMDAVEGAAALARFVSLHPYQLEQKAEVIVEHFRQKTAGKIDGRAKAMVVTRSRLHAVRTKQALDAYIAAQGLRHGADAAADAGRVLRQREGPRRPRASTFTESGMNGFSEAQLPKRFREDDYQVLVVAEKYQTGFDEPLLHTMYVDKKLAGVEGRADPVPAQPHPPGQGGHVRPRLRQHRRGDPGRVRAVLRGDLRRTHRPERALHHGTRPQGRRRAVAGRDGRGGRGAAVGRPGAAVGALHQPRARRSAGSRCSTRTPRRRSAPPCRASCRAYAFVAQVMPWADTDLEQLFLYGKAAAHRAARPATTTRCRS